MSWTGSIVLDDSTVLQDVKLANTPPALGHDASLHFLSIVEVFKIPLYLTIGPPCNVTTDSDSTETWFHEVLANAAGDGAHREWWEGARPDSPLGILVGVQQGHGDLKAQGPNITELLFYASYQRKGCDVRSTPPPSSPSGMVYGVQDVPTLTIHAIALSSDLLHCTPGDELTPPASPTSEEDDLEAIFLPQPSFAPEAEVINEPPVRKRRSAADAFDEASERRRKARRRGGEGVSAAAAPKAETQVPSLHRRSTSNTQPVPLQTRPFSRSPSIASSRPATATAPGPKKSSLSQVQSSVEPSGVEAKNKDFISRIVMAGMRLHGLSQRKPSSRKPLSTSNDEQEASQRKSDEEFKLLYHQVYKGTTFAFRASIAERSLQPFAEQARNVVERLLAIFCCDPLAEGLPGGTDGDEVTPGGRKAFGSAARLDEGESFAGVLHGNVTAVGAGMANPSRGRGQL